MLISENNKLIVLYPFNLDNFNFSYGTMEYYRSITNKWVLIQSFPDFTFPNINVKNKIQPNIILSSTLDLGVITINNYSSVTNYKLFYYFFNNDKYIKSKDIDFIDILKNPDNFYNEINNNNLNTFMSDTGKLLIHTNSDKNYLSIYN